MQLGDDGQYIVDMSKKTVLYNPKVNELYRPVVRFMIDFNGFRSLSSSSSAPTYPQVGPAPRVGVVKGPPKNMLTGYAEAAEVDEFQFENQRRTFENFGYALDPSDNRPDSLNRYVNRHLMWRIILTCTRRIVGDVQAAEKNKGEDALTGSVKHDKRKRNVQRDASDIEGFTGLR